MPPSIVRLRSCDVVEDVVNADNKLARLRIRLLDYRVCSGPGTGLLILEFRMTHQLAHFAQEVVRQPPDQEQCLD